MAIRIMVMVPLYAISSLIALFSLEAAFVIDAIRDIYEVRLYYAFSKRGCLEEGGQWGKSGFLNPYELKCSGAIQLSFPLGDSAHA